MQSIIKNLYNGKIIPWERKQPRNEGLLKLIKKIDEEERYLTQKLSPEDGERFQALAGLYAEIKLLDEESVFSYGFTLGAAMMMDVIKEAEVM